MGQVSQRKTANYARIWRCLYSRRHMRVHEAKGILKIEVPDNVRKIVILKGDKKMDMEI